MLRKDLKMQPRVGEVCKATPKHLLLKHILFCRKLKKMKFEI